MLKNQYGCRMICADDPSLFALGLEDGHVLASTVYMCIMHTLVLGAALSRYLKQ